MFQKLFNISTVICIGAFQSIAQFFPVSETNLSEYPQFRNAEQCPFSISELITVGEFKVYLSAVKRDSSATFYTQQLPQSRSITKKMVKELLTDEAYKNKPMPGVSWTVARNYCKWLSFQSASRGENNAYDLPTVSEMLAFQEIYDTKDTNALETWTLNCFDESSYEFSKGRNYFYNAKVTDPAVLKRKIVFGGSYHMNSNSPNRFVQYEYQDSSSRFVGFRIVQKNNSVVYDSLQMDDLSLCFGMMKNQLNGVYKETHPNGTTKVLGFFDNGQRVGIWSVWNENGEIQVQRNFKDNFNCEFVYPKTNQPFGSLYTKYPEYRLNRNKKGYYPYLYVEERSVVYSKRIWRELNASNEPELFQNIDLGALIENVFQNNIKWYYYGENGDFKSEIPADVLVKLRESAKSWDLERIEVKEDFFFNADMLLSDCRQIGINFYEKKSDNKPKFTLYYPYIRQLLTAFKVDYSTIDGVENLDDVFYFHDYRGSIVQTSNIYQNPIGLEASKLDLTNELNKLIIEHGLWLVYGR
jgi:antitoxin component YwqK of YwqJK toxin-antitoxin module